MSVQAYLLWQEFPLFWAYNSPAWAAKFLDAWCKRPRRPRIEPVKKFAGTVRPHRELLLNDFRAKKAVLQRRHRGPEQPKSH